MSQFPPALAHGPIERVVEDVYAVRGRFHMGPGVVISRTMTVVRHGGSLTVVNSVRLSQAAEAELERLGRVAHVVKLADSHGVDDPYFVRRFNAVLWSLPNARHPELPRGKTLGPEGPVPGGEVLVIGHTRRPEAAYLVPQGGGTLVTCDALQNHVDGVGTSLLGRIVTPLLGYKGGVIVAPMWKRIQGVQGEALRHGMAALCARSYDNLVTGHGPPVVGGAAERVRAAVGVG